MRKAKSKGLFAILFEDWRRKRSRKLARQYLKHGFGNTKRTDFKNPFYLRYDKALRIIKKHARELAVRKKQLSIPGAYGVVDTKPWQKDIDVFFSQVIERKVGRLRCKWKSDIIKSAIDMVASRQEQEAKPVAEMKPLEYEAFVAENLISFGWEARLTKASGDQGVDVIASKDGVRIVIQCKLYSSPVGNAAVQEAISGREFEQADYAAVVSNAPYTKAARQLAATSNVLLLHHDHLAELDTKIATGYATRA